MERIAVQPEKGPFPLGPYSSGIKAGNFLFLAGQVAVDVNGKVVGKGDITVQTKQAWENVKLLVEAAGATMDDIIYTTKYVVDIDNYLNSPSRYIGRTYFTKELPADSLIEIKRLGLPDSLIEIQAVAFIPEKR